MVKVKISSAYDLFSNIEIVRYVVEESTVLNSNAKFCQINYKIEHYPKVNGVEVYGGVLYKDVYDSIKATNDEYVYIAGTEIEYRTKEEVFENGELKEGYILGENLIPQYDFFVGLRGQSVIFDEVIEQQIELNDEEGDFNNYNFVKFSL